MAPELWRLHRAGSTMDRLHELAAAGAPAGTAVVAEEQTGGRGSRGREWRSPRGGLWLSVLLRPGVGAGIELLSLRLGLAVAEAVEAAAPGLRLGLKWPNDLMLGERKAGGVLCEARWHGESPAWITAGVGINVANPIPPEHRDRAAALAEAVPGLTAEALLSPVLAGLRAPLPEDGTLAPTEAARLAARDWLRGRRLAAPVDGTVEAIALDGSLRVATPAGPVALRGGGIELAGVTWTG